MRNRNLRGCMFLQEFLTIRDEKEFKAQKRLREKEKEPTLLSEQPTATGEVDASGYKDVWKFSYKMPEFINNYTAINKNIQDATLAFAAKAKELADIVYDLSKYYEVLGSIYNNMEVKNMYQIHKFMSDVMTCWGDTYMEQSVLMEEKFSKFFTYHYHEDVPMREMIKTRFNLKEDYARAEIRLTEKKERLVKSQDFEKWQLDSTGMAKIAQLKNNEEMAKKFMLPQESKIVEQKRNLLQYFSNQVKDQTTDMLDNNYTDLCMHLIDYACDQKKIYSKAIDNWNGLFEYFNGLDLSIYDDEAEPKESAKQEDQEEKQISPSIKNGTSAKPKENQEEKKQESSINQDNHKEDDHEEVDKGKIDGKNNGSSKNSPDLIKPKSNKEAESKKSDEDDKIEDQYDMINPFDE